MNDFAQWIKEVLVERPIMVSDNPDFNNASWEQFNTEIAGYVLPGDDGEKVIFVKLRDEAGNTSRVVTAKINLKRSF